MPDGRLLAFREELISEYGRFSRSFTHESSSYFLFSYFLTLEGTGTYRVDGTSLFVELTTVSLYADSREVKDEFNLEEFLVTF